MPGRFVSFIFRYQVRSINGPMARDLAIFIYFSRLATNSQQQKAKSLIMSVLQYFVLFSFCGLVQGKWNTLNPTKLMITSQFLQMDLMLLVGANYLINKLKYHEERIAGLTEFHQLSRNCDRMTFSNLQNIGKLWKPYQ